jgi:ABC-2 type transport system ATP-binding protein
MSEYAIEVRSLVKKFGAFTAVNNISFAVNKGEVFGFLGPNGAGKTTTIRMLCGLLDPTSGQGLVAGYDVGQQPDKVKESIGYMSQKFSLYDDLTVGENIDFYAGMYQTNKETRRQKKAEIIARSDLVGSEEVLAGNLSGAVKQHLALSCAMIHEPKIVFLDEPTAGVDPVSRKQFWKVIDELSKAGVTTLVTTHYMDEAERCDRIAMISSGNLIACDSPANLKHNFVQGALIEVECGNVMKGLEVLRGNPKFRDVSLYGIYLHIMLDQEADKAEIERVLREKQLEVKRLERIVPSLEDVFVFLVEKNQPKNNK